MSKKRTKRDGKRRDSQGRVLHTGEYQRPDGLYEYRYTYQRKRHSTYDRDLHSLRRKEEEIHDMRRSGLDYNSGGITVLQLSERYIALKHGVRYSTSAGYQRVMNFLKKRPDFSNCKIRDIRMSDAKLWLISLYDEGYAYSTTSIKSLLKCAFQMAYSEDILRRNPFDFRMDIIPNNTKKRVALTQRQQEQFIQHTVIRTDNGVFFCASAAKYIPAKILSFRWESAFQGRYIPDVSTNSVDGSAFAAPGFQAT